MVTGFSNTVYNRRETFQQYDNAYRYSEINLTRTIRNEGYIGVYRENL